MSQAADKPRFNPRRPQDPDRLPPGQALTDKWPVLHHSTVPTIDVGKWRFEVSGLVEEKLSWSWEEFRALPSTQRTSDIHCVTRWSRYDNRWEGVSVAELMKRVRPKPEARFVVVHGHDHGFSTNLPLADFLSPEALFAWSHDGKPLEAEHGGPLRLVVPHLYFWKSAKWVKGIELLASDRPGLWERAGYHMRGDPWDEERFGSW